MITFDAFFMMKAASSAAPLFTVRSPGDRAGGPAALVSVPNPPNSTLMMLRFMPLHMM